MRQPRVRPGSFQPCTPCTRHPRARWRGGPSRAGPWDQAACLLHAPRALRDGESARAGSRRPPCGGIAEALRASVPRVLPYPASPPKAGGRHPPPTRTGASVTAVPVPDTRGGAERAWGWVESDLSCGPWSLEGLGQAVRGRVPMSVVPRGRGRRGHCAWGGDRVRPSNRGRHVLVRALQTTLSDRFVFRLSAFSFLSLHFHNSA